MNIFDIALINPILNLLILFYVLLEAINLPGALGFSIILLTIAIRLALWPLTTSQLKSTQKMAQLKPHLDRIKEKHGHDKLRHQQEISSLYKEHGVNPLAGCLPLLLQIPVFIALYQVLLKFVEITSEDLLAGINQRIYTPALQITHVPDTSFLGLNLSSKPNEWASIGFLILSIPLITGVLQFIQSKMLIPESKAITKPVKKEKEKESMEDTMASMQTQMAYLMPAMIAFFSYGFPVGLSLYWNTFTVIGIVQQYKIMGAGSMKKYLPIKWQK